MILRNWLSMLRVRWWWQKLTGQGKRKKKQQIPQYFESLEDRVLLSAVPVDDVYYAPIGTTLDVDTEGVLENDGVDPADVTVVLDSGVFYGSLNLNSDGSFTYEDTSGYMAYGGTETFTYHLQGTGWSSPTATVSIELSDVAGVVGPVSVQPDAVLDSATFSGNQTLSEEGKVVTVSDVAIPIDPSQSYSLSAWLRSGDGLGGTYDSANQQYVGFASYDANDNLIIPQNFYRFGAASDATLTQDLNPGDTYIYLSTVANWSNSGTADSHTRTLAIYDQATPDADYTPNIVTDAWNAGAVDVANTRIELATPWAGGTITAGTRVRNTQSSAMYNYTVVDGTAVSDTWTRAEGTVTGTSAGIDAHAFRPGTATIKPLVFSNNQGATSGPSGNLLNVEKFEVRRSTGHTFLPSDTVMLTTPVMGNASSVSYAWTQTAGPSVTLSNASSRQPTFTAPSTSIQQTLTFQVAATFGAETRSASIDVIIEPGTGGLVGFDPTSALTRPVFSGANELVTSATGTEIVADDYIAVDTNRAYELTATGRSGDGLGGNYDPANQQYFGFASYDADYNLIRPWNYLTYGTSADVHLAQPISAGDTVIYLESTDDLSGWSNNVADPTYTRSLAIYDQVGSLSSGSADYTSHAQQDAWTAGAIDTINNTITLSAPWGGSTVPTGTRLRNTTSSNQHSYAIANNIAVTDSWTTFSASIGGTGSGNSQFRPGTAFIKPVLIPNSQGSATPNEVHWKDVALSNPVTNSFLGGDEVNLSIPELAVDPGETVTYTWAQLGGPSVTLTPVSSGREATFTAPFVFVNTNLTFELTANTSTGGTTTRQITIEVVTGDQAGQALGDSFRVVLNGTSTELLGVIGDDPSHYGGQDVDLYQVDLVAGQQVTFDIDTQNLPGISSYLNSHLRLFNYLGIEVASNGDGVDQYGYTESDSLLTYTASQSGEYFIGVSGAWNETYDPFGVTQPGYGSEGAYRLTMSPATNDAPVTQNDTATTIGGVAVDITPLTNDSDPDGENQRLEIVAVSTPANGTVSIETEYVNYYEPSISGYWSGYLDRILRYTPNGSFSGTETLTYTVRDVQGAESTGTVTVTVNANSNPPTNNAPVAGDATATVTAGQAVLVDVLTLASDIDGDAISLTSIDSVSTGTAILRPRIYESQWNEWLSYQQYYPTFAGWWDSYYGYSTGVYASDLDYDIEYTAPTGYSGSATVTFTMTDAQGATDTGTVTVTVQPEGTVNTAPVAADDSYTITDTFGTSLLVLANDSDPDGHTFSITSFTQPSQGSIIGYENFAPGQVDELVFTPATGQSGVFTFTYEIMDQEGATDTATVTLMVGDGQTPVAQNDLYGVDAGQTVTLRVLENDWNQFGGALTIVSTDAYTLTGTVSIQQLVFANSPDPEDVLVYTAGSAGFGSESFSYMIQNANGGFASATVTIQEGAVVNGNNAPILQDDAVIIRQGDTVAIDVIKNDGDVEEDALFILAVTQPSLGLGQVEVVGAPGYQRLVYYSEDAPIGDVTFTYLATDGRNAPQEATVTVQVDRAEIENVAPNLEDDVAWVELGGTVFIPVLENDVDPDDATLNLISVGNPSLGTASIGSGTVQDAQGNYVTVDGIHYIADPYNHSTDQLTYSVTDLFEAATGNVTVLVYDPWAAAPTASPRTGTVHQGLSIDVDVSDVVSGLTSQLVHVEAPSFGTAEIVGGQVRFTAPIDYTGDVTLTYWLKADTGGRASNTVTITVIPNALPTLNDDAVSVVASSATTFDPLDNDADAEGDAFELIAIGTPQFGDAMLVLGIDGELEVVYSSHYGDWNEDAFSYTVRDSFGRETTGTIRVTATTLQDIDLRVDTHPDDGQPVNQTALPDIVGHISGMIGGPTTATVEFDLDGDGIVDASQQVSFDLAEEIQTFYYTPTGLTYGQHTVAARSVVVDPATTNAIVGAWQSIQFELIPATPAAVETFEQYVHGSQTVTDPVTLETTVVDDSHIPTIHLTGTLGEGGAYSRVEFDHDGDGSADGYTYADGDGAFAYSPTGLPNGDSTITVWSTVADYVTGNPINSASASLLVTVNLLNAPDVTALWLATDDATTPTWTSDRPEILGQLAYFDTNASTGGAGTFGLNNPIAIPADIDWETLTWDALDERLMNLKIEFDHNGDGVVDGSVRSDLTGRFRYFATGLSVGTQSIRARAVMIDPEQGVENVGDWSTFEFDLTARPARAEVSGVTFSSTDENGAVAAPHFSGTVTGPQSAGTIIEISHTDTGEVVDFSLVAGSDGAFTYYPASLADGTHTFRFRTKTYDNVTRSNVTSAWTAVTATYTAPTGPYLLTGDPPPADPVNTDPALDDGTDQAAIDYNNAITTAIADRDNALAAADAARDSALASVQSAYDSAIASADSNLATNLANFSGDTTQLNVDDLAWATVDAKLEIPETPLPPVPFTGAGDLVGANLPGVNLEDDPAYQAAKQQAESEYQAAIDQANQGFEDTVQPKLDAFKKAANDAAANRKQLADSAKKALDEALAKVEADLQAKLADIEGRRNSEYQQAVGGHEQAIADLEQEFADFEFAANQALQQTLWDLANNQIISSDGMPRSELEQLGWEIYVEYAEGIIPAYWNAIGITDWADASQVAPHLPGELGLIIEYVAKLHRAEFKMDLDFALGSRTAPHLGRFSTQEVIAEKKYEMLVAVAQLRKELGDAAAYRDWQTALDKAEANSKAQLERVSYQAGYQTAMADLAKQYTEAIAGPRADLLGTLRTALAQQRVDVATAEQDRVTDLFDAQDAAMDAWATANPGYLADFVSGMAGVYRAAIEGQNADHIAWLTNYLNQVTADQSAYVTRETNALLNAANHRHTFATSTVKRWVTYQGNVRQAEKQATTDKAHEEYVKTDMFVNARDKYLRDEAKSEAAYDLKIRKVRLRYEINSSATWMSYRNMGRYSYNTGVNPFANVGQFWDVHGIRPEGYMFTDYVFDLQVAPEDIITWNIKQKQVEDNYIFRNAISRYHRTLDKVAHLTEWAATRVAATKTFYENVADDDQILRDTKAAEYQAFVNSVATYAETYQQNTFNDGKSAAQAAANSSHAMETSNITTAKQIADAAAERDAAQQLTLANLLESFTTGANSELSTKIGDWATNLASASYQALVTASTGASTALSAAISTASTTHATSAAATDELRVKELITHDSTHSQLDVDALLQQANDYIGAADGAATRDRDAQKQYLVDMALASFNHASGDALADNTYTKEMAAEAALLQTKVDNLEWNKMRGDALAQFLLDVELIDLTLHSYIVGYNESQSSLLGIADAVNFVDVASTKFTTNAQTKTLNTKEHSNTATTHGGTLVQTLGDSSITYSGDLNTADSTLTTTAITNAQAHSNSDITTTYGWDDDLAVFDRTLNDAIFDASDIFDETSLTAINGFQTGRAGERLAAVQNALGVTGNTASASPVSLASAAHGFDANSEPVINSTGTTDIAPELAQYFLDMAVADQSYVTSRVTASSTFFGLGSNNTLGVWAARDTMRTANLNHAETYRTTSNSASQTYDMQWTGYTFGAMSQSNTAYTQLGTGLLDDSRARLVRDVTHQTTAYTAINEANFVAGNSYIDGITDWMNDSAQSYQSSAQSGAFFDVYSSPFADGKDPFDQQITRPEVDYQNSYDLEDQRIPQPSNSDLEGGGGIATNQNQTALDDFNVAKQGLADTLNTDFARARGLRTQSIGTSFVGMATGLGASAITQVTDMRGQYTGYFDDLDAIEPFNTPDPTSGETKTETYLNATFGAAKSYVQNILGAQSTYLTSYTSEANIYATTVENAAADHTTAYGTALETYHTTLRQREYNEAAALATSTGTTAAQQAADIAHAKLIWSQSFGPAFVSYLDTVSQAEADYNAATTAAFNGNLLSAANAGITRAGKESDAALNAQRTIAMEMEDVGNDLDALSRQFSRQQTMRELDRYEGYVTAQNALNLANVNSVNSAYATLNPIIPEGTTVQVDPNTGTEEPTIDQAALDGSLSTNQSAYNTAATTADQDWIAATTSAEATLQTAAAGLINGLSDTIGTAQIGYEKALADAAIDEQEDLLPADLVLATVLADARYTYTMAVGAADADLHQAELDADVLAYADLATTTSLPWAQFKADDASAKALAFSDVRALYDSQLLTFATTERDNAYALRDTYEDQQSDAITGLITKQRTAAADYESASLTRMTALNDADEAYTGGLAQANLDFQQRQLPSNYQAQGLDTTDTPEVQYTNSTTTAYNTYATSFTSATDTYNTSVTETYTGIIAAQAAAEKDLAVEAATNDAELEQLSGDHADALKLAQETAYRDRLGTIIYDTGYDSGLGDSQTASEATGTTPWHTHAYTVAFTEETRTSDSQPTEQTHRASTAAAQTQLANDTGDAEETTTNTRSAENAPAVEASLPAGAGDGTGSSDNPPTHRVPTAVEVLANMHVDDVRSQHNRRTRGEFFSQAWEFSASNPGAMLKSPRALTQLSPQTETPIDSPFLSLGQRENPDDANSESDPFKLTLDIETSSGEVSQNYGLVPFESEAGIPIPWILTKPRSGLRVGSTPALDQQRYAMLLELAAFQESRMYAAEKGDRRHFYQKMREYLAKAAELESAYGQANGPAATTLAGLTAESLQEKAKTARTSETRPEEILLRLHNKQILELKTKATEHAIRNTYSIWAIEQGGKAVERNPLNVINPISPGFALYNIAYGSVFVFEAPVVIFASSKLAYDGVDMVAHEEGGAVGSLLDYGAKPMIVTGTAFSMFTAGLAAGEVSILAPEEVVVMSPTIRAGATITAEELLVLERFLATRPEQQAVNRLGNLIGAGGYKIVYEAPGLPGRAFALSSADDLAALEREVELLNGLSKHDIPALRVHGIVDLGGRPAIVMEYFEGANMIKPIVAGQNAAVEAQAISRLGPQSLSDLRRIQSFAANNHVEDFQLLVTREGQVMIADPSNVTYGQPSSAIVMQYLEHLIGIAQK